MSHEKMRFIILCVLFERIKCDDYFTRRAKIIELENKITVGGNVTLNERELVVNECLMKQKLIDADYAFNHPEYYNFSRHFFKYKDRISYSKVYKIIKAMPKGAILHIHDLAIMPADYMLNITYMDNLYICVDKPMKFLFSNGTPNTNCDHIWQLLSNVRSSSKNVVKLDKKIREHFTLVVENPDVAYPSTTELWIKFMQYFATIESLITYKPLWEQYFYDALEAIRKENVMYVEVRSALPKLYELNGTVYDQTVTAKAYTKTIAKFVKDHPDFIGAKLIFSPARKVNNSVFDDYIKLSRELKKEVPENFAGFDLILQEDLGNPLKMFASTLDTIKDIDFYFHAGETNWFGSLTDENLVDAVLLGSKRIGHGYALTKHPVVMQQLIEKDIAIEVNVISNQVVSLVRDVRNHPLSVFLSHGVPVVLSSDDPGAWDADTLSEDFYVAFVAVAGRLADLRMLKTLALNSLKYSALEPESKNLAITAFKDRWNHFVNNFDCSMY